MTKQQKTHAAIAGAVVFILAIIAFARTHTGTLADSAVSSDSLAPSVTAVPFATAENSTTSGRTVIDLSVEYHTADEILTLYHLYNLDQTVSTSYSVQPDLTSLSTSGQLSDATLQNALDTLNFARYIAGLSYDVTLSDEYNTYSQDAAFALAAIGGGIEHDFVKPSWMSDSLYSSAFMGAYYGNLSAGITNLSTNIIHGWLSDEGDNNIDVLGHRRYVLLPDMTETGFGLVYTSNAQYSAYSAMSVLGTTLDGDGFGVVWPAQNMPVEYFYSNYPWSFSAGSPITTGTVVTITREGDGKTWVLEDDYLTPQSEDGYITTNNDYYGLPGCLIFIPNDITYSAGDVYHVQIDLTTTAHYTVYYTVSFFSLSDDYEPQAHVSIPVIEEEP